MNTFPHQFPDPEDPSSQCTRCGLKASEAGPECWGAASPNPSEKDKSNG